MKLVGILISELICCIERMVLTIEATIEITNAAMAKNLENFEDDLASSSDT